jgi:UDP-N-acetylmuramate dehydrogenase
VDKFLENILLANYTTFKIGGPAKYFFVAKSANNLVEALKRARDNKKKVYILGGGSNILISDKGFNGLVIKIDISEVKIEGNKIYAGAGANMIKLAYDTAEKGLSGLEWAGGMPGTVGGSIYGNAHAFGTSMCDLIEKVIALDLETFRIVELVKEQCQFDSKSSIFKKNRSLVIVSAVLNLKLGDASEIKNKIKEYLQYRRAKHPMNFPSAGSVFVNPEGSHPAWKLIHDCGLTGKKIGQAQISEKHTNFIVNLGGAKSRDVIKLIKLAQKEVKKKFKINLEPEIQIL